MASIFPTLKFIAGHPLTSKRPISAYWRYARWQVESRLRDEVIVDWIDGSKLAARNGMTGATGNIYCGLHEFSDMAFVLHLLRPGDLFVDVGANVGSYTVLASAVVGARSIAIEPDPGTAQSLKRNIEINQIEDRVNVVEAVADSAQGAVRFTIGQDTTNQVTTRADAATREVQARSLDEIVGEGQMPVLIKIDVEGYEPKVFAGATATLKKPSLLAVITETADPEIRSAMADIGFVCATYLPFERSLSVEISQTAYVSSQNTLFVRKEGLDERLRGAAKRKIVGMII